MLIIEGKDISGLMTCSDSPRGLCSGRLSGLGVWHTARYSIHLILPYFRGTIFCEFRDLSSDHKNFLHENLVSL